MGSEELIKLAGNLGLGIVLSICCFSVLVWLIKYVMAENGKREKASSEREVALANIINTTLKETTSHSMILLQKIEIFHDRNEKADERMARALETISDRLKQMPSRIN